MSGEWDRSSFTGIQLQNKTMGIIGVGRIGSRIAKRMQAMEMKVIGYDPYIPEERFKQLGMESVDLDTLLQNSDYITMHTPLTKETRGMKFFIDTANVEEIKTAYEMGVICGVTTNPSLVAKEGRDFHGTDIESFPVEILGVMKNSGPSGDLILAKFSGPLIDQTGGIAQGMSGSPVYINGKLLGAIAYGWSFTNSKIGMITPIGDMLKLWNVPSKEEIQPFNAREASLVPISTPLMASGFDAASMAWQPLRHL